MGGNQKTLVTFQNSFIYIYIYSNARQNRADNLYLYIYISSISTTWPKNHQTFSFRTVSIFLEHFYDSTWSKKIFFHKNSTIFDNFDQISRLGPKIYINTQKQLSDRKIAIFSIFTSVSSNSLLTLIATFGKFRSHPKLSKRCDESQK